MKKFTAIFLLSVYMLSATEFGELLKLNVLLQHYAETEKHDGPMSFLHFLAMHYITDDGNNNDNDRDAQLPFKSTAVVAHSSITFVLNFQTATATVPALVLKKDFPAYNDPNIPSTFSRSVWNPPRV